MNYTTSNILSNFLLHILNGEDINEKIGLLILTEEHRDDIAMFLYVLKNIENLQITMENDKFRIKAKTIKKDRTKDIDNKFLDFFNKERKKGSFDITESNSVGFDYYKTINHILYGNSEENEEPKLKEINYNTLINLGGTLSQANDKWDMQVDEKDGSTVFAIEDKEKIFMEKNEIQALIKLIENCSSYCICHIINDDTDKFEGIRMSALV